MKLKRYFPFIVLFVLSCIVLVAFPAVSLLSLQHYKNITPNIRLILTQELGTIAVILLIAWIGVGVSTLLVRIQNPSVRRMVSLGTVLGSFFLCVVLPILGIFLTYGIFSTHESWTQLPAPPEAPKAIAAGGHTVVLIESESGKYFSCNLSQTSQCWQPEDKPNSPIIQGADYARTEESANKPKSPAPGKVISTLGITYHMGPNTYETYYAVLDDQSIWYLNQEQNTASFMTGLAGMILVPISGIGLLFLFGMGLTSFLRWLAGRIWRETESV
jgi:hypothetical protein